MLRKITKYINAFKKNEMYFKTKHKMKLFTTLFVILSVVGILIVNLMYFLNFRTGISNQTADFANFGSYIGGTIGSLFSFLSVLILIFSLNHQKNSSMEHEKIILKQLNDAREFEEQKNTIMILDIQLSKLDTIIDSHIDSGDLFLFISNNDTWVYERYSNKIEGCNSRDEIIKGGYDSFIERNKGIEAQNVSNFLFSLYKAGLSYNDIYIPHNIKNKTEQAYKLLNIIVLLVEELTLYTTSKIKIVSLLKDATNFINILRNIGFIDNSNKYTTFEFYQLINGNAKEILNVNPEMALNFKEIKSSIYRELLRLDLIEKNITEIEFINNYLLIFEDSKLKVKHFKSEFWKVIIEKKEVLNFI